MHILYKKTRWGSCTSKPTQSVSKYLSYTHSVRFFNNAFQEFQSWKEDSSCLQWVHSLLGGDSTWWGPCHRFEWETVKSPSGSPQLTPGWPGNCLVRGIEELSWRMRRILPGAQDWECSRQKNNLWKDAGMRNIKAVFGELEQHNHRTWAEKGHEFIKVIMFKFTQAVLGPRFDKPSLLESDVAACSHGLSW